MSNINKTKKVFTGSGSGSSDSSSPKRQDFRLSLTSATPITTTDVTNASTIYAVPYNGNTISLYDGANWVSYDSAEFNLSLGTLTNAKLYDVFCYANSGVPTLEFLVWTNSTTRATALTYQNGVFVKTGATTRRYLGTFYNPGNQSSTVTMTIASPCVVTYTAHGLSANAPVVFTNSGGALPTGITAGTTYYVASLGTMAANTFNISATPGGALINTSGSQSGTHTCTVGTYTEDSIVNRYLFNYYNAVPRPMYRSDATVSWAYTTATYRQSNANLLNQFNFVVGVNDNIVAAQYHARGANTLAGTGIISGIGLDSTTALVDGNKASNTLFQPVVSATVAATYFDTSFSNYTGVGKHYLSMMEYSSAAGTTTWYGATSSMSGVILA